MMAKELRTCPICGQRVDYEDASVWVKTGKWILYYHEKCVKEEGKKKNDTFRKRH